MLLQVESISVLEDKAKIRLLEVVTKICARPLREED